MTTINELKKENKTTLKNKEKSDIINTNTDINNLITSNLHNPYVDTTLLCPIMLSPNQMDNKLYLHLKLNLKNKLEGKCYKNYGYINNIYTIEELSDGIIEPEDSLCSAKYIVKFSCNICIPIINKEIICKIDRMNKNLIGAINGPIKAIITSDKINEKNFLIDMNRNIRIKKNSEILIPDLYIRVLILSKSFGNYDKHILVIGYLQDIATDEEIDKYIKNNNFNETPNFTYDDEN